METLSYLYAFEVFRYKGISLFSFVNNVNITVTCIREYNVGLLSLHDVAYWADLDWTIEADY